jgi:hypothetical protein
MDAGPIRRERIGIDPSGVRGRIAPHESRHTDVNAWVVIALKSSNDVTGKLPSLALDTGILAGMTA